MLEECSFEFGASHGPPGPVKEQWIGEWLTKTKSTETEFAEADFAALSRRDLRMPMSLTFGWAELQ